MEPKVYDDDDDDDEMNFMINTQILNMIK